MNITDYKKIKGAISSYSGGLENMAWMSLFAFSLERGLFEINYSRSGDSKSWVTTDLAKKLCLLRPDDVDQHGRELAPCVIAPNNCTDRVFFDFLNTYRNKCIIIDDATKLTKKQISLLKEAMGESRMVEYTTAKDGNTRNRFEFVGSIIMNTNYEKQETAISTRAYMNFYYFDHEILLERRQNARKYIMEDQWNTDLETWQAINQRIGELISDNTLPPLTTPEMQFVFDVVDSVEVGFYSKNSMRDDTKALQVFQMFKKFFGGLSKEIMEEAKRMAIYYLTSGILDSSQEVTHVLSQYMSKYSCECMRLGELVDIVQNKFPNHDAKIMVDETLAKRRILFGSTKQLVTLPNYESKIKFTKL